MCGDPYNICLLIKVVKLEMSHVLQSKKIKSCRGRNDRLSVSIQFIIHLVNISDKLHSGVSHIGRYLVDENTQ